MHPTRSSIPFRGLAALSLALSALLGCNSEAPSTAIDDPSLPAPGAYRPSTPPQVDTQPALDRPAQAGPAENPSPQTPLKPSLPVPKPPPVPVHKPVVILSHAHAATCLVGVGDAMPEMNLLHNNGQEFLLSRIYGKKLTVVVFWNTQYVFAREQFTRLAQETAEPFGRFGVGMVAVNVGDTQQLVAEYDLNYGRNFSSLTDVDGQALAQVAAGILPRTYLLDARGRILWFDIEYSMATARELRNALQFYLQTTD